MVSQTFRNITEAHIKSAWNVIQGVPSRHQDWRNKETEMIASFDIFGLRSLWFHQLFQWGVSGPINKKYVEIGGNLIDTRNIYLKRTLRSYCPKLATYRSCTHRVDRKLYSDLYTPFYCIFYQGNRSNTCEESHLLKYKSIGVNNFQPS